MTNQERKEIGQKIRDFRLTQLTMSLHDFAALFGIRPSELVDIENGRLSPEKKLEQLAAKAAKTGNIEDLRAYLAKRAEE